VLGYAGYLPFGLECAVVAGLVFDFMRRDRNRGQRAWSTDPGSHLPSAGNSLALF